MKTPCSLIVLLLFTLVVNGYTWQFTSPPRQCSNVTISIRDSGGPGQPPYRLLIVPNGPSPLPNNTEVRTIQNIPFTGTSTTLSFNLNYPENSSFVAVVRTYLSRHPHFLMCRPPTPSLFCRSATRAVLVPVVPVLRSPFSDRPTRVVTVPLSPSISLGFSTSSLLVDSLNVNQCGCGGGRLWSMGASLHILFLFV